MTPPIPAAEGGPKRYVIETLVDFLKVPENRRAACFREFRLWLRMHDPLITLLTPPEHPNAVKFTSFTWIDDGLRNVSISLQVNDPVPPHAD